MRFPLSPINVLIIYSDLGPWGRLRQQQHAAFDQRTDRRKHHRQGSIPGHVQRVEHLPTTDEGAVAVATRKQSSHIAVNRQRILQTACFPDPDRDRSRPPGVMAYSCSMRICGASHSRRLNNVSFPMVCQTHLGTRKNLTSSSPQGPTTRQGGSSIWIQPGPPAERRRVIST